jgi:threonine/homoserine/homoserine lactone efflux protein
MIEIFVSAFLIGLSGAVAPGPLSASVLGLGSRRPVPFVAGLIAGHGIPEAIVVAGIACGVREVPYVDQIALIGSAVLIAFGILQFRNADRTVAVEQETAVPIAYGAVCTLGNPYWWVWWLTFGVGFLALYGSYVEFFAGHILADAAWLGLLAVAVVKGKDLLGRHYPRVVQASGVAMAAFGVFFLWSQLPI